ncbi:proline-rich protein 3 [Ricinus communis]|uniref:Structural constituent of cell wall, putative n=1 Tax=Ricinus communis TaxID=3988 RepID=B9SAV4_RICCO|nr:proline-rich protein 3 [Ricinus communis]EEF39308.1 structural constituent of cell wall, putative [Ricinus communis]|eukprot:XP_025013852.1 proline-rich protein 3-like [Ricinus communis]
MAFFPSYILLLSFLVIVSAGDYDYASNPNNSYGSTPMSANVPKLDNKYASGSTPTSENVKPDYEYAPKSKPHNVPKDEYNLEPESNVVKPEGEYEKPKPDKTMYIPKPKSDNIKPENEYGAISKPDIVKPHNNYSPKPEPETTYPKLKLEYVKPDKEHSTPKSKSDTVSLDNTYPQPKKEYSKSSEEYNSKSKSDIVKPDDTYTKPKPTYSKPTSYITKPDSTYSESKPEYVNSNEEYKPKTKSDNVKPESTYPKSKPEYVKPSEEYSSKPESETLNHDNTYFTPESDIKSDEEYIPKPKTDKVNYGYIPKPDHKKPHSEYLPKHNLNHPELTVPKPDTVEEGHGYGPELENPLRVGIEGLVLCKSGSSYIPVEGAVARITCSVLDKSGYKTTPFSCLTGATDAKGYFFKALSLLGLDDDLKLIDCKVNLERSPLETCSIPTDVNKGITGAHLSSYRILSDKKLKLFSVGPFFYTSEPKSTPTTGY